MFNNAVVTTSDYSWYCVYQLEIQLVHTVPTYQQLHRKYTVICSISTTTAYKETQIIDAYVSVPNPNQTALFAQL